MYIGRFAPSPTGELHFGSLVAALASYLDAKKNNGLWLLRIDDIDPPREIAGASSRIQQCLQDYGLFWDRETIYQSNNSASYQAALELLKSQQLVYPCFCSRKTIKLRTGASYYDNYCRHTVNINLSQPHVWRFKSPQTHLTWKDDILGEQITTHPELSDFILLRTDKLWAYQLAVAVDDFAMGITHVVRGNDLLSESAKQQLLIDALGYTSLNYRHLPLVTHNQGQKLSKQNHAPQLNPQNASQDLYEALCILGQTPDPRLKNANKHEILAEAIVNWRLERIPQDNFALFK